MSFVSVATGQAGTDAGMALARPMRLESAALQADPRGLLKGTRVPCPKPAIVSSLRSSLPPGIKSRDALLRLQV